MEKKYYLSVTEECVMNPDFQGFRGGRIEVYHPDHAYAVTEFRFFIPAWMYDDFMNCFDNKKLTEKEFKNFRVQIDGKL